MGSLDWGMCKFHRAVGYDAKPWERTSQLALARECSQGVHGALPATWQSCIKETYLYLNEPRIKFASVSTLLYMSF